VEHIPKGGVPGQETRSTGRNCRWDGDAHQQHSRSACWARSSRGEQALRSIGAAFRDATNFITEEPLRSEMCALLLELEWVEDARAKESHNLSHWTSDRDPKKS
jgi:hypothetical protein